MRESERKKDKITEKRDKKNEWYSKVYVGTPVLWDWVYPIYICKKDGDKIEIKNISGTCFHIGRNLFLTANHVVTPDEYNNHFQIGFLNQVQNCRVAKYDFKVVERFERYDIAIIECNEIFNHPKKPKPFHWSEGNLKFYEVVRAMGYPKGYDPLQDFTNARAFEGNRIGSRQFKHDKIDSECYEISIHCLRGLSGTCLLDAGYKINDVIIGNSKDELNVFTETETVIDHDKKIVKEYITNETMYIGLAIHRDEIFSIKSDYLNMSIHDYLKEIKIHECHS